MGINSVFKGLRYLTEKVARINNRKTVYANSLVTAHSFRVCVCCC